MKVKHSIVILFFITGLMISCQSDMKFDSDKWKNGGGENITLDIKISMVNDLIESKILLNKNRSEIAELIGNPEKLHNKNNTNSKHYPIQEKYGLDIDPKEMTFLEIIFNEQGMSESVKIITTK